MPTFDNLAGLTPREIEVLRLVAAGLSNQQIVDSMYLSISTVKSYLRSAFHKLGVQTRTQAVIWASTTHWSPLCSLSPGGLQEPWRARPPPLV